MNELANLCKKYIFIPISTIRLFPGLDAFHRVLTAPAAGR
ncbi:Hypothetical protein ETEE_0460 [Edwardsiella anguillarum ET080813]|uniref:Uncharacterized protein n=1 Tax=Edwardsiella anguillarum ET080813 TaxID=667120 RepID=A0A076LK31_9GAMM|nr:Hypothetical protein ETEE_0460 [Edwardsiella anguillarum ET080813]